MLDAQFKSFEFDLIIESPDVGPRNWKSASTM